MEFRKGVDNIFLPLDKKEPQKELLPDHQGVITKEIPQKMQLWVLTLPLDKKTKKPSPSEFMTARNRIELFCQEHKIVGMAGEQIEAGYNVTIPDSLAPELSTYIRISGAVLSKGGLTRGQRRLINGHKS